jgi:hypothetical protein
MFGISSCAETTEPEPGVPDGEALITSNSTLMLNAPVTVSEKVPFKELPSAFNVPGVADPGVDKTCASVLNDTQNTVNNIKNFLQSSIIILQNYLETKKQDESILKMLLQNIGN